MGSPYHARLEADVVLPGQWRDLARSHARTGPQRLCLAVLEQGIRDFVRFRVIRTPHAQRLAADARDWVAHVGDDDVFSFDGCCLTLGIMPDWLRAGVLALPLGEGPSSAPAVSTRRVLRRLAAYGWTWRDVAAACQVSHRVVSQWASGQSFPGTARRLELEALAAAGPRVVAAPAAVA